MKVRDVMTREVVTVRRLTPLAQVARLLVANRISGVPVVDDVGHVIGVVSEGDFLLKERGDVPGQDRLLARLFGPGPALQSEIEKSVARTAGDAMTTPAVTIGPEATLREAAARMVERGINRLPVEEDGHLVGLLARSDLVRSFARSDEDLAVAIRDNVIRRAMWLDPARLDVSVRLGEVRVRGSVERRSDAEILESLVRRLDGVVGVDVDVSWSDDDSGVEPPKVDTTSARSAPR